VNENQIKFPDYVGNGLFMTLGNLVSNPLSGILVIDFNSGSALQLTGSSEVHFQENSRFVQFTIKTIIEHSCYSPFQFELIDYSPYNPKLVVSDVEGEDMEIINVIEETHDVKTFVFRVKKPVSYVAGMYASFFVKIGNSKMERTWTVSCAPEKKSVHQFSITVKRKKNGIASNYLHDNLNIGSDIRSWFRLKSITGDFTLDLLKSHPANILMIAGGIGITPLFSMIQESQKTADITEIKLVNCVHDQNDVVFASQLEKFDKLKVFPIITKRDGHLNQDWLEKHFPDLRNYEIYLCGPESFMKSVLGMLVALKFNMENVYLERFYF